MHEAVAAGLATMAMRLAAWVSFWGLDLGLNRDLWIWVFGLCVDLSWACRSGLMSECVPGCGFVHAYLFVAVSASYSMPMP